MNEKKKLCPICEKFLFIVEENAESNKNILKVKVKIWCRGCKNEVFIEI